MHDLMQLLENTVTPAILTNERGRILYRNPTAKLRMIGRRTSAVLTNYLTTAEAEVFTRAIEEESAAIVSMICDRSPKKLLVLPYKKGRQRYVLLLAVAVLQSPQYRTGLMRHSPPELFGCLHPERLAAIEQSPYTFAEARLLQLYEKLLALRLGDEAGRPIQLSFVEPILRRYLDNCTGRFGIELDARLEDTDPASRSICPGQCFLVTVLGITTVLLCATSAKKGKLALFAQQDRIHAVLEMEASAPLRELPDDIAPLLIRMAAAYPVWAAELAALGEICRRQDWIPALYRNRDGSWYLDLEGGEITRVDRMAADDTALEDEYRRFLAFLAA